MEAVRVSECLTHEGANRPTALPASRFKGVRDVGCNCIVNGRTQSSRQVLTVDVAELIVAFAITDVGCRNGKNKAVIVAFTFIHFGLTGHVVVTWCAVFGSDRYERLMQMHDIETTTRRADLDYDTSKTMSFCAGVMCPWYMRCADLARS
jgi:hypothetical protein